MGAHFQWKTENSSRRKLTARATLVRGEQSRSQVNSSRKQHERCWPLIGHKKQSQTSIRISHGTDSLRVESQGLSCPFLKTFRAVFPDPTDRPWVSEDGLSPENFACGIWKAGLCNPFYLKKFGISLTIDCHVIYIQCVETGIQNSLWLSYIQFSSVLFSLAFCHKDVKKKPTRKYKYHLKS